MKIEERVLSFLSGLLEIIVENIWTFVFVFWFLSNVLNLFGADEPKATINEPTKTEQKVTNDGPKPNM